MTLFGLAVDPAALWEEQRGRIGMTGGAVVIPSTSPVTTLVRPTIKS